MGRREEEPVEMDDGYRQLLREAVERAGGQTAVARLIGVHQTTISRTLAPSERPTYTTVLKLSRALPGLPSPVVPVRSAAHETWCRIGAALAEHKPALFSTLLDAARQGIGSETLANLERVVKNPMPASVTSKRHRAR